MSFCLLAGCSNTKVSENVSCAEKDWGEFGRQMAETGREVRTIDKYKNSCSTFDENDLDAYLDGYSRGLVTFCTYDTGYQHGSKNMEAQLICPYEIRQDYVKGYNAGKFKFDSTISDMKRLRDAEERDGYVPLMGREADEQ